MPCQAMLSLGPILFFSWGVIFWTVVFGWFIGFVIRSLWRERRERREELEANREYNRRRTREINSRDD